jgi:glucokinase
MNVRLPASSGPILVGDIGATNARFSVIENGRLAPPEWLKGAEFPVFMDAVQAFLDTRGRPQLTGALLAVAGPVENDRTYMTNRQWTIDGAELRQALRLAWARLINDFEATAWSLPHLGPDDVRVIGGSRRGEPAPLAALGPGTGFGVSCYVPGPAGGMVIASEGGHVTLAGGNDAEDRVIEQLRRRFGHVSVERVLSGAGLENLFAAYSALDGIDAPARPAAEITQAGLDGTCPRARGVLEMFCALLGDVAGNVALTFGARGGVFIAGGIAPRILDLLERSEFRARFDAKGPAHTYVEAIPTSVIVNTDASFIGLKALIAQATAPYDAI